MNPLQSFFVRVNALVLTGLFFLIPYVISSLDFAIQLEYFYLNNSLLAFIFFIFSFSAWLWSIGITLLQKKHAGFSTFYLSIFKLSLISPLASIFIFLILNSIDWHNSGAYMSWACYDYRPKPVVIFSDYFLPSAFLLSFLYNIFQTVKIINFVELQRPVSFKDMITDLLCFVFFPMGLWLLQQKVNELSKKPDNITHDLSDHLLNS